MQHKYKALLRRSRARKNEDPAVQAVNDMESERMKDSRQNIDVLDTKLFEYDFGMWFAKAMIMYTIAMIIQKFHQGRACTNPQAVLNHMEARFWKKPGGKMRDNGTSFYPEIETFNRINSARGTKNEKTLQTYLDELWEIIKSHCQDLRDDDVAELDAAASPDAAVTPDAAVPPDATVSPDAAMSPDAAASPDAAVLPDTTASNRSSSKDDLRATDTSEHTGSSSQDEGDYSTDTSSPNSSPVSPPSEEEPPMHEYTSTVWEFAAQSGREPKYVKKWGSTKVKICEASLGDVRVEGEARNYKDAKHIASRKLCQALNISLLPKGA